MAEKSWSDLLKDHAPDLDSAANHPAGARNYGQKAVAVRRVMRPMSNSASPRDCMT